MRRLIVLLASTATLCSLACGQDDFLATMKARSDVVAHVEVLRYGSAWASDTMGVWESYAVCQVIECIKGHLPKGQEFRVGFDRFESLGHKEPVLLAEGSEYVVFLRDRYRPGAFSSDRWMDLQFALADRWVGALPYSFHLVRHLKGQLKEEHTRTMDVPEVDRGVRVEMSTDKDQTSYKYGETIGLKITLRNSIGRTLLVPTADLEDRMHPSGLEPYYDLAGKRLPPGYKLYAGKELVASGATLYAPQKRLEVLCPSSDIVQEYKAVVSAEQLGPGVHKLRLVYEPALLGIGNAYLPSPVVLWNGKAESELIPVVVERPRE